MFAGEIPNTWKKDFNPVCELNCSRLQEIKETDFSIMRILIDQAQSTRNPVIIGKKILHSARIYRQAKKDVKQLSIDSSKCETGAIGFPTDMGEFPICGLVAVEGVNEIMNSLAMTQEENSN